MEDKDLKKILNKIDQIKDQAKVNEKLIEEIEQILTDIEQ